MDTKIKRYLIKYRYCINIKGIELGAGLPVKTIDHWLKGRRQLTEEAIKKLDAFLSNMNYKNEKFISKT